MSHSAWSTARSFTRDRSVADRKLAPGTTRRILTYARPYRGLIAGFLVLVVFDALLVVATPLLFRRLIDDGVAKGDRAVVVGLALVVAALAVVDAAAGLAQRWFSSRIGEGLIYDLRTQVFGHVLRQPVAFFTRAQTGALVSRLNNDVIGAQQAFTSTLSGVVSNVVSLVLVAGTMLYLSWPITVVSLLLFPLFLLAGPADGHPDGVPHPGVDAAQRRARRPDDRALQRRRRAARQAVRPAHHGGRRVLRAGGAGARHRRPDRHDQPGLLHGAHPGRLARHGRRLRRRRGPGHRRLPLRRHPDRAGRPARAGCTARSPRCRTSRST